MWFARTSPIQMWINWKCNDFPIDFIQIGRLLLCVLIKVVFVFHSPVFHSTLFHFPYLQCGSLDYIWLDHAMPNCHNLHSIYRYKFSNEFHTKKTINRWFKYAQISWFLQYHISCRSHWNDSLLIKRFRLNRSVARRASDSADLKWSVAQKVPNEQVVL